MTTRSSCGGRGPTIARGGRSDKERPRLVWAPGHWARAAPGSGGAARRLSDVEGVNLVSNYRTQFNKIIQTSGYSALLEKMKSKQAQFAGQDAQKRDGK